MGSGIKYCIKCALMVIMASFGDVHDDLNLRAIIIGVALIIAVFIIILGLRVLIMILKW